MSASQRAKVIIIDDSRTMIAWVEHALSATYDVVGISNPLEAAAAIFREKPDLVLLDVKMPVLQGDKLVELVRRTANHGTAPVVFFSSLAASALQEKVVASGADGFIEKGGTVEEFAERVGAILAVVGQEAPAAVAVPATPLARDQDARTLLFVGGLGAIGAREDALQEEFRISRTRGIDDLRDQVRLESPAVLVVCDGAEGVTAQAFCEARRDDPILNRIPGLYIAAPGNKASAEEAAKKNQIKVLVAPFTDADLLELLRRLANIAPRRSARLMVRVSREGVTDESDFTVTFSRNVSSTGMLLELPGDVAVGELIELHFFIPGHGSEVAVRARSVRSNVASDGKSVVAVQYETPSESVRHAIEAFVSQRRNPTAAR